MNAPSTPHQRLYIRCLLRDLEYPTDRTTLQFRVPFERAKLTPPAPDRDFDQVMRETSKDDARKLITALLEMTARNADD